MSVALPSGCTIDSDTWDAMKASGGWRGWLDARMYKPVDRDFMDKEIGRG